MIDVDQLLNLVHRATAPLRNRIVAMVGKFVIEAADDAKTVQEVKFTALADEVLEGVPHMQPGGISHVPIPGAEGMLLSITGDRDNAVAICVADRSTRPTGMNPGETALYSNATGEGYTGGVKILLAQDGGIEINPLGSSRLTINGDTVMTGQLIVQGQIYGKDEITAKHGTTPVKVTTHIHPAPMGPTSGPTPGT